MADKDRKDDAAEREDDEEGEEASSAEESPAEDGSTEDGEARDEAAEETDEPAEDDDQDGAAQRVAAALGVEGAGGEGDEAEATAEAQEPDAVQNRALRRREAALERRRRKGKTTGATTADADESLPKDKNARAKELLKRRREQATTEPRPINLLPGEMVDDALARSTSAITKWLRQNFGKLQWVIVAGAVAAAGYGIYNSQSEKKAAAATDALAAGIAAERGRVLAEDKRSDEEKEFDPAKIYKTTEERTEAALAAYRKTIAEYPTTAASLLARLGEAGVLIDKRSFADAADAYAAVLASKLAATDLDVKGRATEGLGLAKEGKADLDGALAAFKELQGIEGSGFKELGMYHEARILLAKGDKDKAKELLKQVHDKLTTPTATDGQHAFRYLEQVVDETLRKLDPSAVPTRAPVIGGPKGNSMTPEELEKIKKMIHDASQKKGQEPGGDEH